MRYYKIIENGYIVMIGTGNCGTEITEEEYNNLLQTIRNKPSAPSGYGYKLKTDLTWEEYELPQIEETEPTAEEILNIILGGEEQ